MKSIKTIKKRKAIYGIMAFSVLVATLILRIVSMFVENEVLKEFGTWGLDIGMLLWINMSFYDGYIEAYNDVKNEIEEITK